MGCVGKRWPRGVHMTDKNPKLTAYYDVVANSFPANVREALRMIGSPLAVQLLALRRYIRKAKDLQKQWVWSDERIKAYAARQPEPLGSQIKLVREKFTELNPGYSLGISPIRNLKSQVDKWKANATVAEAAHN